MSEQITRRGGARVGAGRPKSAAFQRTGVHIKLPTKIYDLLQEARGGRYSQQRFISAAIFALAHDPDDQLFRHLERWLHAES